MVSNKKYKALLADYEELCNRNADLTEDLNMCRHCLKDTYMGITNVEYNTVIESILEELSEAKKRQKTDTAKPSDYMRGLKFALQVLATYEPHMIGGEDYAK